MFLIRIIFASQGFLVLSTPYEWIKSPSFAKKSSLYSRYLFLVTWQVLISPSVNKDVCFMLVPQKQESTAVSFKCCQVIGLKWIRISKLLRYNKKTTLNHFKYFFFIFFFISVSFYSFFFQFSFNIKCTSSYMHHETCCKICHNKHQSKWQRHWSLGFVFRFPPAE